MEEVRRCDDMAASLIREHNTILSTAQGSDKISECILTFLPASLL